MSIYVKGLDETKNIYEIHIPQIIRGEIFSEQINQVGDKIYEIGTNLEVRDEDGVRTETKGNYVAIWKQNEENWFISQPIIPPIPN